MNTPVLPRRIVKPRRYTPGSITKKTKSRKSIAKPPPLPVCPSGLFKKSTQQVQPNTERPKGLKRKRNSNETSLLMSNTAVEEVSIEVTPELERFVMSPSRTPRKNTPSETTPTSTISTTPPRTPTTPQAIGYPSPVACRSPEGNQRCHTRSPSVVFKVPDHIEPLSPRKMTYLLLVIHQNLKELKKASGRFPFPNILGDDTEDIFNQDFPIQSSEDLEAVELLISRNSKFRTKLVNELYGIGGKDPDTAIFGVMDSLLGLQLASNYTYNGTHKTSKFSDLQLSKIVQESIQKRFKDCSQRQISGRIGRWLTEAKDPRKMLKKRISSFTM